VKSARLPPRFPVTFACALFLVAIAIGTAPAVTLEDATGRRVNVQDTSRIVSIGGAVTEILYALGLDKKIVAIDTTSLYPPRAAGEKKSVGYMRQLSPEGVLGLAPSLIVTIEGAGPKETMTILQSAGISMVVAPDHFTGEGIVEKIALIARATDSAARGRCVIERVQADLTALGAMKRIIARPKRVLFVLSFVSGRAMVAGRNTAADGIIRLAGATNAITEYEGYKPINDEAVVAARPDVVLVMERSSGQNLTSEAVFTHPAFGATPAAANKAFVSMDGLYLLGFGPRSARAARDLAASIYPDLKSKPLPSDDKAASADACRSL
jgi:iron complex transport system substrate-binding protein